MSLEKLEINFHQIESPKMGGLLHGRYKPLPWQKQNVHVRYTDAHSRGVRCFDKKKLRESVKYVAIRFFDLNEINNK